MPRHSLAIVLIALVCLLCSNKNAGANMQLSRPPPYRSARSIGALQDSHQSSATLEPVAGVSNNDQPILSHSDIKRIHPSPQEAKLTALDASNDRRWCIAKPSSDADQLQRNINSACRDSKYAVSCHATEQGGVCYTPGNKVSEASYDMNLYYQKLQGAPGACYFNNSGLVISQDPSWGSCNYQAN